MTSQSRCTMNNKYYKWESNKQNNNAMTTTKYKPVQIVWSIYSVQKDNEKLGEI